MNLLFLAAVLLCAAGCRLLARLRPMAAASAPEAPAGGSADLSIIIPARNEAHNLPALLGSLAGQSLQAREILVVDDHSSDDTAAIARSHGATVVSSEPLPDGWRGKTWACHQGARAATGRWLCFLDADTFLATRESLARLPIGGGPLAFSLCPWHAVRRPYEHLSLFFNLNMVLGTVPHGLFGQCLVIDRSSYDKAGGHARVHDKVLENVHLAADLRAAGVPLLSAPGRGVVSFRMYPGGLRDLIEGWTKGFASGAGHTPGPVLAWIIAWLTGLMLVPIGLVLSQASAPWLVLFLLSSAQVAWLARRVGNFRWWLAPLHPLALVFFFALFSYSAMRAGKKVTWKGREFDAR